MARVVGFEPTHQGVWSRILDLNQYTAKTVFKLIHRILLKLILESPLPYHLATPVYLCTSPPNPDSPQRTSNSFLRPTGHGLFYLSFCYHYEVHERRNFSCLYERNKRLSGVRDRRLSGFSYFGRRNLKQRRPHALIYFYNQSYNFSSSF